MCSFMLHSVRGCVWGREGGKKKRVNKLSGNMLPSILCETVGQIEHVIILILLFNLLKLLQPQPQALGMRPPVSMATAPIVTPRNQSPGHIVTGPQQLRQLTSGQSTCILCQRCVWSVCRCDADISRLPCRSSRKDSHPARF